MGLFGDIRATLTSAGGETVVGTITGIKVWERSDEDSTTTFHEFRIELPDGTPLGIRQEAPAHVRLGSQVPLKQTGKTFVIDWDGGTSNWKMVKPPPAGIDDERNGMKGARKRWTPVGVTVAGRAERPIFLGLGRKRDLEVTVGDPGSRREFVKNSAVPNYATHLASTGTVVPAFTKGDTGDIIIDWAAAAVATPGVDAPHGDLFGRDSGETLESVMGMGTASSSQPAAPAKAPKLPFGIKIPGLTDLPDPTAVSDDDLVDWATFIAVEKGIIRDRVAPAGYDEYAQTHGVPAGSWGDAKAQWMSRIYTDPTFGAQYGQAMSER